MTCMAVQAVDEGRRRERNAIGEDAMGEERRVGVGTSQDAKKSGG